MTGQELARRALVQAEKFGAELTVARTAVRLACECERRPFRVELGPGVSVQARTVVIATGAKYRKPAAAVGEGSVCIQLVHKVLAE